MKGNYKLSRRTLLTGGTAAVVFAAAYPLVTQASEPDVFAMSNWTPLVGQELQAGPAVVVLENVTDLRQDARLGELEDSAERYRLAFGLVRGQLPTESLEISHPRSGAVQLFITHSGAKATAVIDRRGANLTPPVAKDQTHE
ncbi:hypothetical protein [Arthrobacter sp. CJ23]|uniref:hypothetical protein n=1 Tax=Arthrobacter sp. CJ23 TaxID=2972479 RepID=UPI00215CF64F|nr:hypothetical protein [Arthrobacter sp. CJ23]UVJ40768.1 hypothetical protein NVV90_06245 [Arthrobacter sp. CJ23]